jgi:hypothetical protein
VVTSVFQICIPVWLSLEKSLLLGLACAIYFSYVML